MATTTGKRALEGWYSICIMVIIFILLMAIQVSHGLPTSNENYGETKLKCTEDPHQSIVNVENCNQEFYVNPTRNFSYFQISMKIESCYPKDIYRGNRYYGKEILQTSDTGFEGIPVSLSCTIINGTHAYFITIKQGQRTLMDMVDTATPCGRCHGFKMKAIGATVCTEEQQNEKVQRITRHVAAPDEASLSKTVEKIRRWSNLAYLMAILLSIGLYATFLIVMSFRKTVDAFRVDRLQRNQRSLSVI
ncbi:uncharacterized protein [Palaemon carinicauda]|uniref:uncharacterized protein n=1 Tax=Palaemon carinicauda TaxID=392227 RepID=UPI0035B5A6AA